MNIINVIIAVVFTIITYDNYHHIIIIIIIIIVIIIIITMNSDKQLIHFLLEKYLYPTQSLPLLIILWHPKTSLAWIFNFQHHNG